MTFTIHCHLERDWTWLYKVATRGSAFDDYGCCLAGREFSSRFERTKTVQDFVSKVRALNGFFAVVVMVPGLVMAAVDRVRSIPLFYAVKGSHFYLSDNAYWIWRELGNPQPDWLLSAEFLLTGYVTGPDTLMKDIKQLQAGEIIAFDETGGSIELERYFKFAHCEVDRPRQEFVEILGKITDDCIKRLAEFAKGRTIVIPLSGGLDSRLIAMKLKAIGYPNLVAFSYGRVGNAESEVSRQVSEQLKIPWKFVTYSHNLWREWYCSSEYAKYREVAGGLCSLAHIQDWPAVWQLSRERVVPPDAVFVPGHSADFLAGSHIPSELALSRSTVYERVIDTIWKRHYLLNSVKAVGSIIGRGSDEISERLLSRIGTLVARGSPNLSPKEAVSAFESWDWQERQAKFIVNSVRVYEYWGYSWWLPWWDMKFMDYWQNVGLSLRINKNLYDAYVSHTEDEMGLVLTSNSYDSTVHLVKMMGKKIINRIRLMDLALRFLSLARLLAPERFYNSHPLCWYGLTDLERFRQIIAKSGSVNAVLVHDQLKTLLSRS